MGHFVITYGSICTHKYETLPLTSVAETSEISKCHVLQTYPTPPQAVQLPLKTLRCSQWCIWGFKCHLISCHLCQIFSWNRSAEVINRLPLTPLHKNSSNECNKVSSRHAHSFYIHTFYRHLEQITIRDSVQKPLNSF